MRAAVFLLLAACAAKAPATPKRAPITFEWLGVAGWIIETTGATIVTDPYLTHVTDFDHVVFSDSEAIRAHAPKRADLVLVGHSHIDHLLDAPGMALRTGAQLMGSVSTTRVGREGGVPADRLITIAGGEDYEFGAFSVRVIPSLHSALDDKHTFGGRTDEIGADMVLPLTMDQYREGGTYAYLVRAGGHQIVILDTANFIERELEGIHPDIAIIAPGLREQIHDYTCRLLHVLGDPPIVLVTHFGDWKKPPVAEPPSDDLKAFEAEITACSPATRVIIPKPYAKLAL